MATDSSHRVTMENKKKEKKTRKNRLEPLHFYRLFILAGNHNTSMYISKELDFVPDSIRDLLAAVLEHLENVPMYSLSVIIPPAK